MVATTEKELMPFLDQFMINDVATIVCAYARHLPFGHTEPFPVHPGYEMYQRRMEPPLWDSERHRVFWQQMVSHVMDAWDSTIEASFASKLSAQERFVCNEVVDQLYVMFVERDFEWTCRQKNLETANTIEFVYRQHDWANAGEFRVERYDGRGSWRLCQTRKVSQAAGELICQVLDLYVSHAYRHVKIHKLNALHYDETEILRFLRQHIQGLVDLGDDEDVVRSPPSTVQPLSYAGAWCFTRLHVPGISTIVGAMWVVEDEDYRSGRNILRFRFRGRSYEYDDDRSDWRRPTPVQLWNPTHTRWCPLQPVSPPPCWSLETLSDLLPAPLCLAEPETQG